ncbi:rhomboid family intramembrane serine protease [Chitinophaga caeni]|uniref:Rhomboid family intramembrane serine protease n=1 Tax=Chitinophaga caeni TaxID=2029983 RepID=A0A291QX92_9BACT|nr:rhomboid family intramembrane serine protease [Chitinophaga caeni]ATL48649.1 rhomboid family intramembrane serine protease [Chitinophaga caeni]
MHLLADKLRLIYKPFVLIATGFILTYTLLHWVLFIKGGIPIKEEIVSFWLPFGLPWIPILIWLRPRIKLLHFNNDNGSFFYQLLASLAIAFPTIIAQGYLVTATGKITPLDNIAQISKHSRTKYYSLKDYYVDKQHIAVQSTASVTGRHNEDFNLLIYIIMPILESESDTAKFDNKFWLGKKYYKKIGNSLSDQEKDEEYRVFAEESQKKFNETDFGKFTYLEVIGNTDDHDEFNNALKKIRQGSIDDNIIFEAKAEPFEARNGSKLPWVFGTLGIGFLAYFIFLLFSKFEERELKKFKSGRIAKDTTIKDTLEFFIPKPGYYITPIIIILNLLVYTLMVFAGLGLVSFKGSDLLNWGANFGPLTTGGQWWRLLTSIFLHGGLMHILANMYGLMFVGIFLEPLLGKMKYALVYLITGLLASVASIWWYDATISVGASGAIFGLYGLFLACLLLKIFPPGMGKAFVTSTLVFVGVNLLMGFTGGIDNAAHIGGLLSGFFIGLIISRQLKQQVETTIEY